MSFGRFPERAYSRQFLSSRLRTNARASSSAVTERPPCLDYYRLWSRVQFVEQVLGFFQITRVKTLSEPPVHRRQEFARSLHRTGTRAMSEFLSPFLSVLQYPVRFKEIDIESKIRGREADLEFVAETLGPARCL